MSQEPILEARKSPKQARSKATVEAILEAAARLLIEDGVAKTTTNRIAKRAGVSVGSLYQYFPNKEAILIALGERLGDEQMQVVATQLTEVADRPLEEAAPQVIRALIEAKRIEPELSRMVFQECARLQHNDPVCAWLNRVQMMVAATLATREEFADRDVNMIAFIVTQAVHGIILGVLFYQPELMDEDSFIEETAELVLRYLSPNARAVHPA